MILSFKQIVGGALIVLGSVGLVTLLFFYAFVLFSNEWTVLSKTNEALRLIFSIKTGLLVMYATFVGLGIPLLLLVIHGAELYTNNKYITKIQNIGLICFWFFAVLIVLFTTLLQVQTLIAKIAPFSSNPTPFDIESGIPLSTQYAFKTTLKNEVVRTQGVPIEGFVPEMFLKAFAGLTITDFEGMEASIGYYTILEGKLVHKLDEGKLIHSAAEVLTDRGLDTLLANVSVRLGVDLAKDGTLTQIMDALIMPALSESEVSEGSSSGTSAGSGGGEEGSVPSVPATPNSSPEDMVACTMEAKICPDGSAVGRSGPRCEFAPCPSTTVVSHMCTDAESNRACTREYQPVCASVAVQCVTTPCNPVPETFGNGCSACADPRVLSYTEGSCKR